jgi:serine/threonine-protein kinase
VPEPLSRLLGGRYRIIREIARGGMGIVCLAYDKELEMNVALKLLPPQLSNDPNALKQLRSEAKLSMSLAHPNVLRLHNLDTSGKSKFLVMEYVDGPNLKTVLKNRGKLKLDEVFPIIRAVCMGLDYAHSERVLHRDLKPANIMLTAKKDVKIADFGIARQMKESMTSLSQETVAGTPLYMAPEHLMGHHLTVRSDIYSLGAVTYELLAGYPPFHKGDILAQIRFNNPEPIPGLPDPVNRVILNALSKDPQNRPASAADFYKALKDAALRIAPASVPVRKTFKPEKQASQTVAPPRPVKRRIGPRPEFVFVFALIVLGAVGYYLYMEFTARSEMATLMRAADRALEESEKKDADMEVRAKLCVLLEKCESFKKDHPYSFKLLTETELDDKIATLRTRIKQIGK